MVSLHFNIHNKVFDQGHISGKNGNREWQMLYHFENVNFRWCLPTVPLVECYTLFFHMLMEEYHNWMWCCAGENVENCSICIIQWCLDHIITVVQICSIIL